MNNQDFEDYPTKFFVLGHPTFSQAVPLPASGPQSGNTTIAVVGANFQSPLATDKLCKFGLSTSAVVSPAHFVDDSKLICITPPRELLIQETVLPPAWEHILIFDGTRVRLDSEIHLTGDAHITDAAMVLTRNRPSSAGTLTVPMREHSAPVFYFEAAFEALIGGGEGGDGLGGEGMHFFFGAAPKEDKPFTYNVPVNDGLSLLVRTRLLNETRSYGLFRSYDQVADVFYNSASLARVTLQDVRTNLFEAVELSVSESGLRVAWRGVELVGGVSLLAWRPQAHWLVGVAAATGSVQSDHHWLRSLTFRTRRLPPVADVSLKVTVNAQQYTGEDRTFTYYGGSDLQSAFGTPHSAPLVLSSASPSSGPIAGGSRVMLRGSDLAGGSEYVCSFGSQRVNASFTHSADELALIARNSPLSSDLGHIWCILPSASAIGTTVLRVSPNAQQFSGGIDYMYHGHAAITDITPPAGPQSGGTVVRLHGVNLELGAHYVCVLGGVQVPASLAPSSVEDYLEWTYLRDGLQVSARARSMVGWPAGCTQHYSTSTSQLQRVAAAISACATNVHCDSVYYNDCDPSPHVLYMCPRDVSFPTASPPDGCTFRQVKGFRRLDGHHCLGQHYSPQPSIEAAVAACSADSRCGAVYDHQCDGSLSDIYLCPKSAGYTYEDQTSLAYVLPPLSVSPRGSCIYLRPPWRTAIECTMPPRNESGTIHIAASLNAQQYFGNASVTFRYMRVEGVYRISPTTGPVLGGTRLNVYGTHLDNGTHYRCRFNESSVPATFEAEREVISCLTPAAAAGTLTGATSAFEISLNAQQFTTNGVRFAYFEAPTVSSFDPSAGPSFGATSVTVAGQGFAGGSDYRCRFDACGECDVATGWSCGACVVNASYVASGAGAGSILCTSPPLAGWSTDPFKMVNIEVSLNSQQYTSNNASYFSYYERPILSSVSPILGPLGGNTRVVINGTRMGGRGTRTLCSFNTSIVVGTFDADAGTMVCRSATGADEGNTELRLSLNGQQYTETFLLYRFYTPPALSAVLPGSGPTGGGTTVQVSGLGLDGGVGAGPDYLCRFGGHPIHVPATLNGDPARLSCVAPAQPASVLSLEVSVNGQQFSSGGAVVFKAYNPPNVSLVFPPIGPRGGGTRIVISAAHLDPAVTYVCLFDGGSSTTAATYSDVESAVACSSPAGATTPLLLAVGPLQDPTLPLDFNFYDAPIAHSLDPTAGPILGGTLITVTGSDFPSTAYGVQCIMGTDRAFGTRVDAQTVRCETPTLHMQGTRATVYHDFSYLPEGASLRGNARVTHGELRLAEQHPRGSILLESNVPPRAYPSMLRFVASWHVWAPRPVANQLAQPLSSAEPEYFVPAGQPYPRSKINTMGDHIPGDDLGGGGPHSQFSLSFGDLHAPYPTGVGTKDFDGDGAGRGLRVVFSLSTGKLVPLVLGRCPADAVQPPCRQRLARSDTIDVRWDRRILASINVGRNLSVNTWSKVTVRIDEGGVSVEHDGSSYLTNVTLPAWYPQSHWLFGIGGSMVAAGASPADGIRFDNWNLSSAYLAASHTSELRLSFSPQQHTAPPLTFDYYRPPVLSSIEPNTGPVAGATSTRLHGLWLAGGTSNMLRRVAVIRFDGALDLPPNVSSSELMLVSTPAVNASSNRPLQFSLNGQQFDMVPVRFRYLPPAFVDGVEPTHGPLGGATNIIVRGRFSTGGFSDVCRFKALEDGASATVSATLAGGGMHCISPAWPTATNVSILISGNAQQFTPANSSAVFAFYDPPHLSEEGWAFPLSSFAGGAALISLRGLHLDQFASGHPPLYCLFGGQLVLSSNLSCVAPADANAGAGVELSDADLSLRGAAVRDQGAIKLTDHRRVARAEAGLGSAGYAIVALPPPAGFPPPYAIYDSIRADFQLLLDAAGHGVSFIYGDVPSPTSALSDAALAEEGGGAGLRVLFLTAPRRALVVLYDSERLALCPFPARPANGPAGPWHEIVIEYRAPVAYRRGLLVTVDGHDCVSELVIEHWRARVGWHVGFGAQSGAEPARHWLRALRLQLGSRVASTATTLSLTTNLQQFSDTRPFIYPPAPRVSAVVPSTGPSAGGIAIAVLGSNLHGTQYRCVFRQLPSPPSLADETQLHLVVATYRPSDGSVLCQMSPQAELPHTSVPLTLVDITNTGQQYTFDSLPFSFYPSDVRTAHRLLPGSGPSHGGSALRLPLRGLNQSAVAAIRADGRACCVFNGSAVAASFADADGSALHCDTPPFHLVDDIEVQVSLNGQQLLELADDPRSPSLAYGEDTPHLFFAYIEPELLEVEPPDGLPEGNAAVQVTLSPPVALAAGSNVSCRFGEATAPGALLPPTLHATAATLLFPPRHLVAAAMVGALGATASVWQSRLEANGMPPEHIFAVQYDANPIDEPKAQWYHNGRATCVAHGTFSFPCDRDQLVCTGHSPGGTYGDVYGNLDQQALAVTQAVLSAGGVHPSCPSLVSFDAMASGAFAWPHQGAADWFFSTVVRRGLVAASPSDLAVAWRAFLRSTESELLNCTTPSAAAAAAAWHTVLDFNCGAQLPHSTERSTAMAECATWAAAAGLQTSGAAALYGGLLRLTHAGAPYLSPTTIGFEDRLQPALPNEGDPARETTVFGSGSAILTLPSGTHVLNIHLEFDLIIGGGTGGEGFSVSYGGELPLGYIGEQGAGLGLRVLFLTHLEQPRIEVVHDGELVGSVPCTTLRSGVRTHVAISASHSGVTVRHGGYSYFEGLPLPHWSPQQNWQLAFGAATSRGTDNHWIDELRVWTGAYVDRTPVPVTLSLNGQQYASEALTYTFGTIHRDNHIIPDPPPPTPPPASPPIPPRKPPADRPSPPHRPPP